MEMIVGIFAVELCQCGGWLVWIEQGELHPGKGIGMAGDQRQPHHLALAAIKWSSSMSFAWSYIDELSFL